MRPIAKTIISIIINSLSSVLMLLFSFISPYRYEWDETLKQVDDDKLLVLRVFWILTVIMAISTSAVFKSKNKVIFIWSIVLLLISLTVTIFLWII